MFKKNNAVRLLPVLIIALLLCVASASAQTELLRFPDIHGGRGYGPAGKSGEAAPATSGAGENAQVSGIDFSL